MNQKTLKERLSALKIEPPSPEAEDRAIRAGLDAFERSRRQRSPGRPRLAGLLGARPVRRRRHWLAFGAASAVLFVVVVGTALWTPGGEPRLDLAKGTFGPSSELDGAAVRLTADLDGDYEVISAAAAQLAATPPPERAKLEPTQVALTAERAEHLLRVYDRALRREFGAEVVDQLHLLAQSGQLEGTLETPQGEGSGSAGP